MMTKCEPMIKLESAAAIKLESAIMGTYVLVGDGEDEAANKMELPADDDDGSLTLATLQAAFPGATGLKYKNPKTGAFRGISLDAAGQRLLPPAGGWGDETLYLVIVKTEKSSKEQSSKRRKVADDDDDSNGASAPDELQSASKQKRYMQPVDQNGLPLRDSQNKCVDLLVLGLPFTLTQDELNAYFTDFGDVVSADIKKDYQTGKQRGFGFVRMKEYEAQQTILDQEEHIIGGRKCTVKIPWDKRLPFQKEDKHAYVSSPKIFVGRVTEDMTQELIKETFEKEAKAIDPNGNVAEVFIPKPFRAFAFVTFNNMSVTRAILNKASSETFMVGKHSVFVGPAVPKTEMSQNMGPEPSGSHHAFYDGNYYGNKMGPKYDYYGKSSAYAGYGYGGMEPKQSYQSPWSQAPGSYGGGSRVAAMPSAYVPGGGASFAGYDGPAVSPAPPHHVGGQHPYNGPSAIAPAAAAVGPATGGPATPRPYNGPASVGGVGGGGSAPPAQPRSAQAGSQLANTMSELNINNPEAMSAAWQAFWSTLNSAQGSGGGPAQPRGGEPGHPQPPSNSAYAGYSARSSYESSSGFSHPPPSEGRW